MSADNPFDKEHKAPMAPDAPIAPAAPEAPMAPSAPEAPTAPGAPEAPMAPMAPSGAPEAPEAPMAPGEPSIPGMPLAPKIATKKLTYAQEKAKLEAQKKAKEESDFKEFNKEWLEIAQGKNDNADKLIELKKILERKRGEVKTLREQKASSEREKAETDAHLSKGVGDIDAIQKSIETDATAIRNYESALKNTGLNPKIRKAIESEITWLTATIQSREIQLGRIQAGNSMLKSIYGDLPTKIKDLVDKIKLQGRSVDALTAKIKSLTPTSQADKANIQGALKGAEAQAALAARSVEARRGAITGGDEDKFGDEEDELHEKVAQKKVEAAKTSSPEPVQKKVQKVELTPEQNKIMKKPDDYLDMSNYYIYGNDPAQEPVSYFINKLKEKYGVGGGERSGIKKEN